MLMIIAVLAVLGLVFGSFVNALVWRIHEQSLSKKPKKDLSIVNGRSMCPDCHHELSALDLAPVFSWLYLRGKCRYCKKPISAQYPIVELSTSVLFVISFIYWPLSLTSFQYQFQFGIWLLILIGLVALTIYDIRWMLLPNRLLYPISVLAGLFAFISIKTSDKPLQTLMYTLLAVVVGGGIFYVLFQVSGGKWIGGGDVKLGWMIGLLVGTPTRAVLMIFLASVIGSIFSAPLLARGKLKPKATIPFGPFLIAGAIIVVLFGTDIIDWYTHTLIGI